MLEESGPKSRDRAENVRNLLTFEDVYTCMNRYVIGHCLYCMLTTAAIIFSINLQQNFLKANDCHSRNQRISTHLRMLVFSATGCFDDLRMPRVRKWTFCVWNYYAIHSGKSYTWKQAFKVKAKAGFEAVDDSESIFAALIDKLNGKAADESGSLLIYIS